MDKNRKILKKDEIEIDISKLKFLFDKIDYILLVFLGLLACYIRGLPRIDILQAIDPYYIYRITDILVNNHFTLPDVDHMRYYPTGFSPYREYYVLYYIYGAIYALICKPLGIEFLKYAQYMPVILSFFYVPILYFITIEIFGKKYRIAGLFSGLGFALSNATIFRCSKGFFEKEPLAGIFILLSFLFFVKSQKRGKILDSILAGIFTAFAYSVWGGSIMLLYLYTAYIFFMLFLGRVNKKESIAYIIYGISYLIIMKILYIHRSLFHYINMMVLLSVIGIGFLITLEKFLKWNEKQKRIYFPSIIIASFFVSLLAGFFIPKISQILMNVKRVLIYKKQVIESTVAENVAANVGYFLKTFGVEVTKSKIDMIISFWFIGLLASYIFILKNIKDNIARYIAITSHTLAIISYYAFLKSSGENTTANVLYILFVVIALMVMIRENLKIESLLYLFNYATLLMFVTKVRISYPTGLFVCIFVGYGLGMIFYYIKENLHLLFPEKIQLKEIIKISGMVLLSLYLLATIYFNVSYASFVGKSLSYTEKNQLWDEALRFLKNNTPENSVILSWWDFGYWFQTLGNRKTLLDGGNQMSYRNVFAAKYFTGRYNKTWDMLYLDAFHPTHILVDYTMIGKYAAMSKIANNGLWIDSYAQLSLKDMQGKYLIYAMPYYKVYVPLTENNSIDFTKGITLLPRDMNPIYISQAPKIRYLCTHKGIIDLSLFDKNKNKTNYVEECLYILPGYPQIAYLTFTHPNNKVGNKIFHSNFHKLYIENGERIPYVKKVFDNFYVKIYEINYTYIENELSKYNITRSYIQQVLDACSDSYRTGKKRECPLYYDEIDYSAE